MDYSSRLAVALLLCVFSPAFGQAERSREGEDHPLLSRFPGSEIIRYESEQFGELDIPLGPATGVGEFAKRERVEGKITRITYEAAQGHSTLEVLRSYRDALVKGGFEILYSCTKDECGPHLNFQKLERPFIISKDHRYLAAKDDLPGGPVYVTVRVYTTVRGNPPVRAMIGIAEVQGMQQDLITVDAAALARDLEASGHAAVYGIYFDTDKTEIKPGSEDALREIARLLETMPELEVYVVGHTDNVGSLEYNMNLSERRAVAVVEALASRYGVEAGRLTAVGVGALAPVASNRTEEGRAKNRRVELVEK